MTPYPGLVTSYPGPMTSEYRVNWTRDGEPISTGPEYQRNGLELKLAHPLEHDEGDVVCTVTNQAGSTSYLFRLGVLCEYSDSGV